MSVQIGLIGRSWLRPQFKFCCDPHSLYDSVSGGAAVTFGVPPAHALLTPLSSQAAQVLLLGVSRPHCRPGCCTAWTLREGLRESGPGNGYWHRLPEAGSSGEVHHCSPTRRMATLGAGNMPEKQPRAPGPALTSPLAWRPGWRDRPEGSSRLPGPRWSPKLMST